MFGLFGKKKDSSSGEMEFLGITGQVSTLKCLILAGIKDVSMRTTLAPADMEVDHVDSYQFLEDGERVPSITQGDFSVAGARAIQTYLDIRGKAPSLVPRKARILGQQNYWIELCYRQLAPAVHQIVNGKASEDDMVCCNEILTSLNNILAENLYVAGPLTLADHNVAAYIYVLRANKADLSPYPNIDAWISRLEGEMSDEMKKQYIPMLSSESQQQVA